MIWIAILELLRTSFYPSGAAGSGCGPTFCSRTTWISCFLKSCTLSLRRDCILWCNGSHHCIVWEHNWGAKAFRPHLWPNRSLSSNNKTAPPAMLLQWQTMKKKKKQLNMTLSKWDQLVDVVDETDTELQKNTSDGCQICEAPQQINVPWRSSRKSGNAFKNFYLLKSCLALHIVTPTISPWRPEMNRKVLLCPITHHCPHQ